MPYIGRFRDTYLLSSFIYAWHGSWRISIKCINIATGRWRSNGMHKKYFAWLSWVYWILFSSIVRHKTLYCIHISCVCVEHHWICTAEQTKRMWSRILHVKPEQLEPVMIIIIITRKKSLKRKHTGWCKEFIAV